MQTKKMMMLLLAAMLIGMPLLQSCATTSPSATTKIEVEVPPTPEPPDLPDGLPDAVYMQYFKFMKEVYSAFFSIWAREESEAFAWKKSDVVRERVYCETLLKWLFENVVEKPAAVGAEEGNVQKNPQTDEDGEKKSE